MSIQGQHRYTLEFTSFVMTTDLEILASIMSMSSYRRAIDPSSDISLVILDLVGVSD
jgi:hypothetical protein